MIPAGALLRCWREYRAGNVEYRDVRVWLAAHELVARRCRLGKGRKPAYGVGELSGLVRGGGKHFRPSLRRLEARGLISWGESSVTFPKPEAGPRDERRLVPVPRRTLRFLASCPRPVVAATALGHLVRCLYYRGGVCLPRGSCKASWVSETFGVDLRSVKAARKHLAGLGWLRLADSPHWHRQRWGQTAVINLAWRCNAAGRDAGAESPPLAVRKSRGLPPPESHEKLPSESSRNQELKALERSGVCTGGGEPPSLADVRVEDLMQFSRTEALYRQAVARGWVRHSESQALGWVGAAVRAKSVPGDPVRVFVAIVRKGLWHHVSNEQEERARAAMARYREVDPGLFRIGPSPGRGGKSVPPGRIGGRFSCPTGDAAATGRAEKPSGYRGVAAIRRCVKSGGTLDGGCLLKTGVPPRPVRPGAAGGTVGRRGERLHHR